MCSRSNNTVLLVANAHDLEHLRSKSHFNTSLFTRSKLEWLIKTGRRYFYLSNPYEEMYRSEEDVIDFYTEALPLTLALIFLEWFILYWKHKKLPDLIDGATSASMILLTEVVRILFRGAEHSIYIFIYKRYRVIELPWDSLFTWYWSAILIDFCYYWAHRAAHEICFIWAHHQAHHSSETFSLVNVLRLPVFQDWVLGFAYLPLALFIPPAYYLLHLQFSILYQFWIHTELIGNLGPYEYVFNTPTHHKVHHGNRNTPTQFQYNSPLNTLRVFEPGCNRICLDKNYGGWLIIWDRMFGTFQDLPKDQELVFGLVDQPQSYNVIYLETFYFYKMYEKWKSMTGLKNKLLSLIKGPGWTPSSKHWTGDVDTIPDIRYRPKFTQTTTWYWYIYHSVHFLLIVAGFEAVSVLQEVLGRNAVTCHMMFVLLSLTVLGTFLDERKEVRESYCYWEFVRCLIAVFYVRPGFSFLYPLLFTDKWWADFVTHVVQACFFTSALIWGISCCRSSSCFKNYLKRKPN